jgi:hypothetical protein
VWEREGYIPRRVGEALVVMVVNVVLGGVEQED